MKKLPHHFLTVLFFLSAIHHLSAQSNTLLWRISGNGLKKPSFLFGTMHVNDKKVFNFTDSLYFFLDQTEAFASELNGDSASQILGAYFNGDVVFGNDTAFVKAVARRRINKIIHTAGQADSSVTGTTTNAEYSQPAKSEINFFNGLPYSRMMMNTFMDAYLYQVACSKGKKIYGLENIYDQASVAGEFSTGFKQNGLDSAIEKWDIMYQSPVPVLYSRENIDSLNLFYTDFYTEDALEQMLYKRNRVMTHNMDSLMHLQSLFTAVGAAHLSGKKGIIQILKNMGYTLTPVFSSKRLLPLKIEPVTRKSWRQTYNTHYGFSYEMPGSADSIIEDKGNLLLYNYDIGAGYIYIMRSGLLNNSEQKKGSDDVIRQQLTDLTKFMNGFLVSRKFTELNGRRGMEMVMNLGSATVYRVKEFTDSNMYYIIELGAEKKEMLFTETAERYFNSFNIIPRSYETGKEFITGTDGFSIRFPGTPVQKQERLEKETSSKLTLKTYTYLDTHTGINFSVICNKTINNNELKEAEGMLNDYQDKLKEANNNIEPMVTDTTIQGYPARLYILHPEPGEIKQSLLIRRDNVCYYIIAECDTASTNDHAIKHFFNSFALAPFNKAQWTNRQSPGKIFSAWLPSQVNEEITDSSSSDFSNGYIRYYSTDPNASVNYEIEKHTISNYFWAHNIDSVYNFWKENVVKEWRDSVISYSSSINGNKISKELILLNKQDSSVSKKRFILNGHNMYLLALKYPKLYPDEANMDEFLSSFSLSDEQSSDWIIANSSANLFSDLHSADSATFEKAFSAIDDVKFEKDDIAALLKESEDSFIFKNNFYYTVNSKLIRVIKELISHDESGKTRRYVNEYIQQHYLTAKEPAIRFGWLGLLADDKTQETYGLIKKLLSQQLPEGDESYNFYDNLSDSLKLTATLFPEMLDYTTDSSNGMAIAQLTNMLLDSSLLDMETVKIKEPAFLQIAQKELPKLITADEESNYDYDYRVTYLLSLLEKMKDKVANEVLRKYLKSGEAYLQQQAAIALIKNGQNVSTSVFSKLAGNVEQRISLYDDLKKMDKLWLFPSAYADQKNMAEGYINQSIEDEDEYDTKPEYIYIRTIDCEYKGQVKRFYLFRINFYNTNDENNDSEISERENYLAVAGPFDLNEKNIEINEDDDISGLYYDEKFGSEENEVLFKKYIGQFLKDDE